MQRLLLQRLQSVGWGDLQLLVLLPSAQLSDCRDVHSRSDELLTPWWQPGKANINGDIRIFAHSPYSDGILMLAIRAIF